MKYKWIFFFILMVAIVLRFNHLGSFPPGFTWDEAAIGYNAFGILTVHRDEFLNRLPLSFRSFGDYKSPLLVYLVAGSEAILGVSEFAVRFPVALAGVFLVIGAYFLTRELVLLKLLPVGEEHGEAISLLVMALVAISPWAWHFSMIAFESMVATSIVCWASVWLLSGIRRQKPVLYLVSGSFFALSLYAYHSAKIVAPLLILCILALGWKKIKNKHHVGYFFLICLLVGAPIVYLSLFGKANERLIGSSIIFNEAKQLKPVSQIIPILVQNFLTHLSPSYLLMGAEQNYRQSNMRDGILSPAEGILILLAIILMAKNSRFRSARFLFIFIAISILPATLGSDVPHANRSLLGLPWFQILAAVGFIGFWETFRQAELRRAFLDTLILVMAFGALWHSNNEQAVYATSKALVDLQYGYKEAVMYARNRESEFDKIVFTNEYGQAYIFILFYKQMSPIDFRGGGLANYQISDHPWKDGAGIHRALLIGGPDEFPEQVQAEKTILYPDGKVAFKIVKQ